MQNFSFILYLFNRDLDSFSDLPPQSLCSELGLQHKSL